MSTHYQIIINFGLIKSVWIVENYLQTAFYEPDKPTSKFYINMSKGKKKVTAKNLIIKV